MMVEGPSLALLMRYLTEIPVDFMGEPHSSKRPGVHVDAVVHDVLERLHHPPTPPDALTVFQSESPTERNRLRLTLLSAWLLTCEELEPFARPPATPLTFLQQALTELAMRVDSTKFMTDPERREELVRRVLQGLGCRPQGESVSQATDRLAAVDSVARARVLEKTRKAQERAQQLRAELQAKAAQEAAAKISRE